jgi:hypothetical protein
MDPSQYKSKELNLYSYDGTKRLHVKENEANGTFVFDYKDDQNSTSSAIQVINQHVEFEDYFLPLDQVLSNIKQSVVTETTARALDSNELWGEIDNKYTELDGKITSESSLRTAADVALVNGPIRGVALNLEEEIKRAVAIETSLRNDLTGEQKLRSDNDVKHANEIKSVDEKVDQESVDRYNADQILASDIKVEAKARADADGLIQITLLSLSSGASSSIVEYKQLVDDEKKRATEAEGLLNDAIVEAKQDADLAFVGEAKIRSSEDAKIAASVEAEAKRATEEEGKLSDRLDFILHNTTAPALDSLSEIVSKFSTDGQGYAERLTYLEGIVMALVNR